MIVYTRGRMRELRSGVPRDGRQRLHAPADRRAGQSQQRQRVGDRRRRAPGSRSRAHRRRDDLRQGAGAVGLSHQRQSAGLALTTGALLHAERPPDSASVGRHASTSTSPTRCAIRTPKRPHDSARPEVHRRRPQGVRRRRHRARQVHRRSGRGLQPDAIRPQLCARQAFADFADRFTAEGDTRMSAANQNRKRHRRRGFTVDDAMLQRLQDVAARRRRSRSTRRPSRRTTSSSGR